MDYKNAGVDIEAGYKSVELMKEHVKKTMREEVLGGLGGFSGAFSLAKIKEMEEPVPLSGTEIMGYTPGKDCVPADAPDSAEKDITFFEGLAETYIAVKPGMFAIFFPQDGHAPGISPDGVKKVIVKVKA